LYRSFEYKQNVPLKKHIFYRQVYDALFDWHDATKDGYNTREKKSGLDIDAFHRVLRVIGFVSVMKGEVEGDTDAVLGWIRKARGICSTTPFSESHFLDDLVRAVPIFVKDGDLYRWSHKSLAEYFAAQYICTEGKPQQGQVLSAFLATGRTARFSNVLDQVYEIDTTAFRSHLILPMARAFTSYWTKAYKGLDSSISAADVVARKELLFDRSIVIFPMEVLRTRMAENELAEVVGSALGRSIQIDEPNFGMYMYDSSPELVMAVITGAYSTIAEILASKKDPLVRWFAASSATGRTYRYNAGRKPHLVTDSPNEVYNRPANFARFTESLTRHPLTYRLDSERVLSFESTFQDVDRLSELADELVKPMLTIPANPEKES
jgi:hypothetical protein